MNSFNGFVFCLNHLWFKYDCWHTWVLFIVGLLVAENEYIFTHFSWQQLKFKLNFSFFKQYIVNSIFCYCVCFRLRLLLSTKDGNCNSSNATVVQMRLLDWMSERVSERSEYIEIMQSRNWFSKYINIIGINKNPIYILSIMQLRLFSAVVDAHHIWLWKLKQN